MPPHEPTANGSSVSLPARFDALVRPHVASLYRTAYRYTRRREDAEDLVQELLTKLYPRTMEIEAVEDLRPWLMRSLYNAFIDHTRKQKRTPSGHEELEAADLPAADDPQADVLRHEQRQALNRALESLSPEHRAVVALHLIEGHSLPELAAMLGVQIGTLKSRLHRAKAQLHQALDGVEPFSLDQRVTKHGL